MAKRKRTGDLQQSIQAARPEELAGVESAPTVFMGTATMSANEGPITEQEYDLSGVEFTPKGLPRGIAGTEVIVDPATGRERLVYATGEGRAKVDVVFGTPAPIGGTTGGAGTSYTASDGTTFTDRDIYLEYEASLRSQRKERQSAFDLLYGEFSRYGLGSLVETLRGLITDSTVSPSEFSIRLRQSEPYKQRFKANSARITKGLRALTEAQYLELEDSYQDIMRRYGLPETYYTRGEMGRQQGFEDLIGFDVSPPELEDRIAAAQERVKNAPPEVLESIKTFYGDTIRDGDILAYVIDPKNAVDAIKRKVAAAEIGAGARQAGLGVTRQRAEELGAFGVTGEQARQGFQAVAAIQPRGAQLAEFYKEAPLTQTEVESEVFGTTGAVEARRRRERLVGREQAAFSGSAGTTQGALARERAGGI
jgi:hypothetical protein